MQHAGAVLTWLDLVGAVQNIVETAADDDVAIKRRMRDEVGVGLDGERELVMGLPGGDDFKERYIALKGGMPAAAHALVPDVGGWLVEVYLRGLRPD